MQGPPVNIVLIGLLVLFFGLQLRDRKEQPYSNWLVGWVLIFLSYAVWEVMPLLPAWRVGLELLRVDLLALGTVSFLVSFLLMETGWKHAMLFSGIVLCPVLVVMDLALAGVRQIWLLETLAIVGGLAAMVATYRLIPREWRHRRGLLYGLCCLTMVTVTLALRTDPDLYIQEAFLSPMQLGAAILYLASSRSRRTVRILGGLGFLLWAEFYVFSDLLPRPSFALQALYQFWDLPKYCVGMAMILELFEASRITVERLADRYRLLYENLNLLYETHPSPMWIYETATGKMLSANATAVKVYGYDREEWMSLPADALEVEPETQPGNGMSAWPVETVPIAPNSRRALHRHKNGQVVTVLVVERSMIYETKRARVVLAIDVTEQEKVHQELFHRAHHDTLTQLPNRELLADRMAQMLARSERDGRCAVLLTIDIDHFKQINDTYGHPVGDECLKMVASRLQSRIRSVDTLARTGGEEFTAIIGGLSRREDAVLVAESLRRLFDAPLALEEHTLQVTISIGGALFPDDGTDLTTLSKLSDAALYTAKRSGRNRSVLSTAGLEPVAAGLAAGTVV